MNYVFENNKYSTTLLAIQGKSEIMYKTKYMLNNLISCMLRWEPDGESRRGRPKETCRLNIQQIRKKLIFSEYVQIVIINDMLKVPNNPIGGNFTIQDGS